MDVNEKIEVFKEFIELHYKSQLYGIIQEGKNSLFISFKDLVNFNHELADELLDDPEETIKLAEVSLEQFDLPDGAKNLLVRFKDLPETQRIRISDIRSVHLGKFLYIEGIVRQASDVRPQVVSARFECAGCGNTLSILQIDTKFKEPSRCTCGWRGKFRLLSKELIDVQHLKIEESPENLEGGEQPKRLSVFLKQDLVDPKMERRTVPGSKVRVQGVVKEVPIQLKTGAQSTRYDLVLESNNIEPMQEDYSQINLTGEDEEKIKVFSKDPFVFDKFVKAIAPSIYGHDRIKEALVLQLLGGLRREKPDGTTTRGDIHVLLIGDPGCIAGDSQVSLYHKGMEKIYNLGSEHLQPINEVVTKIRRDAHDKPYDFATVFQKYKNQPVLRLTTETGKQVICTYNQPFLTKEGWKRADELLLNTKIRVMPKIPNHIKSLAFTNFLPVEKKSGSLKNVIIPSYYTKELAALCGYIIGDGNIHPKGYRVTCYVNEEEKDLLQHLCNLWRNVFGIEPAFIVRNTEPLIKVIDDGNGLLREFVSTQNIYLLEINSKQITSCLSPLSEKRVPQQIFQSPKEVIAEFIAWLFEADGCSFSKGRGRTSVQLKSKSVDLLRDVQLLLLYFGIHSRIVEDNLCIRRSYDIELFARSIGFRSQKKKNKLLSVLYSLQFKSEQQKRKKFQRYERVVDLVPFGSIDVYDFEVPVSHRFIANGIVCHNSGKSQLLQFISKAAPKARFVSGKGASLDYNEPLLIRNEGILQIVKIGEFVDLNCENIDESFVGLKERIEILSLNLKTKKLEWKYINSVYRHKTSDKLLKFTLESGRQVTVTKDHSIFILEDGKVITKNAGQLNLNNCVVIPSKIPHLHFETNLSLDIARLIGYYIAEGHMRNDHGSYKIEFTLNKSEDQIINDIRYISKLHLNSEARAYPHGENGARIIIYGKEAYFKFAHFLPDVVGKDALTKRVPLIILNSNSEIKKQFINGYIAGDAGVTKSRDLMSDLLYLYLEESVIASCNSRLEEGEVQINNRKINMKGYRYDLKAPHLKKKFKNRYLNPPFEALNKLMNDNFFRAKISNDYKRANCKRFGNRNFLKRLEFVNDCILAPGPELKREFGESILEYFNDNDKIFTKIKSGRQCFVALSEYGQNLMQELLEFQTLMNGDLGFVRIKKIEEVNSTSEYVYDVSVPGNENFIGGFGGIVCHNSGAGITASVVKDEFLRGWALEAGALPLANKGICVVDELDKINKEDTDALHSAMEQQIIPINKANIQATLTAQTTLLAAANPKYGRFDPYSPIASQIDLPSTLINRFDLIFPVRDIPSKERDERIALHVLESVHDDTIYETEVSIDFMRKYISYAKTRIKPKLTKGAITEIKDFYVGLRNSGKADDEGVKPIPISARQLEGLIRLSTASARVRLDTKITKDDAKKAIDLLKYCLMQVGFDPETGQIDIDRISSGITASARGKIIAVKEIIRDIESRSGKKEIAMEDVIAAAAAKGIEEGKVEEAIDQLKKSGDIFEPRRGFISKVG
ncbi:ATP-binding protein [Candidatus Woesearchaeota archaeon]|nr:ATP-binding protein [Candidatus Woesearchaeota archaeon]